MPHIECDIGDLFPEHIEIARQRGCSIQVGIGFKLWGKWVYEVSDDGKGGKLIALFSRGIGQKATSGAYLLRPNFEEIAKQYNFVESANEIADAMVEAKCKA